MLIDFPIKPLICIVGSTAVGKTRFALSLAKEIGGEIISADSRSFYRGMDIGTAKPSTNDLSEVPHHLVNIANPDEIISLNLFLKLVKSSIADIHSRGKLPLLVGGTGQYIRAILEGWQVPEGEPDNRIRETLEKIAKEEGAVKIHGQLAILDKDAAKIIDPANVRRTVRALEVILTTGHKFSKQRLREGCQYSTLMIGLSLPRKILYTRVDERIEDMVSKGLEEETRRLIEMGYTDNLPAMSAIGYKEMAKVIHGEINQDEAVTMMKKRTRVFIRRQSAWFHEDDPDIHWFESRDEILADVLIAVLKPASWKENTSG
jgi:tRNA dimethylallyltransferase